MSDENTSPQGLGNYTGSSDSDWRSAIQDEGLRQNPTILNIKAADTNEAINALSDQLVNAQKVIGGDKILRPKEDWESGQLRDWKHDVLGVPKSAEDYKLEGFKAPDGMHIPEDLRANFIKEVADPLHLSDTQASSIFQNWIDSQQHATTSSQEADKALAQEQLGKIKEMWGDSYDANMELSEYGLRATAPESLVKKISENELLSTDPDLINTFYKVGKMLQSDNPAGLAEQSRVGPLGNKASALQRINELENSEDYLRLINPKTVLSPTDRMRKDTLLEERTNLYNVAYSD